MRAALPLFLLLASCPGAPDDADLVGRIRAEDIRKHQEFLGSAALGGRAPGSEGSRKASAYIVDRVKDWGYVPAGTDGGWVQPFGEGRRNVAALHRGSVDEYVVVGAHYDHLGTKDGVVYPGADDNASGTSTLLDVAESVGKARFARGVLFVWFDGEENQLQGSRWWTSHPTLPLERCVAMVNVDMIGRNETTKIYCGVEKDAAKAPRWPKWAAEVKGVEAAFGAPFDWTEFDPFIKRSDHWPFMEKGVPALFFTGGLHADYHQPGDTLEKINFEKEERVGRIVMTLLERVAKGRGSLK